MYYKTPTTATKSPALRPFEPLYPHRYPKPHPKEAGKGSNALQQAAPSDDQIVTIRINGLKHRVSSPLAYKGTFSDSIRVRADTALDEIPSFLLKKYPGKAGHCQYLAMISDG